MPTREQVINKLRECGFRFKKDSWRVSLFKRSSDMRRVEVPKRDIIADEWVRSTFRQIGLSKEDIDSFIRHCTS